MNFKQEIQEFYSCATIKEQRPRPNFPNEIMYVVVIYDKTDGNDNYYVGPQASTEDRAWRYAYNELYKELHWMRVKMAKANE